MLLGFLTLDGPDIGFAALIKLSIFLVNGVTLIYPPLYFELFELSRPLAPDPKSDPNIAATGYLGFAPLVVLSTPLLLQGWLPRGA